MQLFSINATADSAMSAADALQRLIAPPVGKPGQIEDAIADAVTRIKEFVVLLFEETRRRARGS